MNSGFGAASRFPLFGYLGATLTRVQMSRKSVLIIGTGHLAYRIRKLARDRDCEIVHVASDALRSHAGDTSVFDAIAHGIQGVDLHALAMTFLVDDHDERNFELLIALVSIESTLPIVASFFNENIAPHLQAAHPNVRIMNPAKIAAPTFVAALDTPVTHTLRYVPAPIDQERLAPRSDNLIPRLMTGFGALVAVAVAYFHMRMQLSWLDALYFVVVTVATVGYGDITLKDASPVTKVAGIALILASTVFIWMIFSLTVDNIIKRRVQLALGRKRYGCRDHVILCGLGRLGSFIAEGLLARGEHVLVVERNEDAPAVAHLRALGADVYIGVAAAARARRRGRHAREGALLRDERRLRQPRGRTQRPLVRAGPEAGAPHLRRVDVRARQGTPGHPPHVQHDRDRRRAVLRRDAVAVTQFIPAS